MGPLASSAADCGLAQRRANRGLVVALAGSLALHALILVIFESRTPPLSPAPQHIDASLAGTAVTPVVPRPAAPPPAARAKPVMPRKPEPRPRLLASAKPRQPAQIDSRQSPAAENDEMSRFLNELAAPRTAPAQPSLAQRSLAMAREYGRQQAKRDDAGTALLERRPDAPPPDPFSLELYLDGLVRKLNRSAATVRGDPRTRGLRKAAVHFRINPDGSLKSFTILNEADQSAAIALIRSVVERTAPFGRFPADLDRAARSLGITVCIEPGGIGGGFGFSRAEGQSC
ncbi:hypothetical protein [Accumulibacter sp.]|uniref:hypothetical protein n=1 Tax=Accumulibacter sp. TaxID=2053492 RepID=UPI0025EE1823|nr:hypothetical protein [Accumulibacter sp.]MCM8594557.1 hypothetical protein [Accumulibacter sp.]MCM8627405.1 hypothetical protein [Accumulibacter sp.]MDS4048703.1 hypothetical protein [Accumulibacter sp.]